MYRLLKSKQEGGHRNEAVSLSPHTLAFCLTKWSFPPNAFLSGYHSLGYIVVWGSEEIKWWNHQIVYFQPPRCALHKPLFCSEGQVGLKLAIITPQPPELKGVPARPAHSVQITHPWVVVMEADWHNYTLLPYSNANVTPEFSWQSFPFFTFTNPLFVHSGCIWMNTGC